MSVVKLSSNQSRRRCWKMLSSFMGSCCFLFLLPGCSTESTIVDQDNMLSGNILDGEDLFDENTEIQLSSFLDSLEAETGIDFVLATVSDPGAEGLISYAASMTRKISPGQPGLNNGAIIYLSDDSREVKVECGYGMEWYVSDTASGFIIEKMRPFLVEGDYKNAARNGFLEIAQLTSGQDWDLDVEQWNGDRPANLETGMILGITGKGIARAYQEGVPEATQFHPNYYIEVLHGEEASTIYFSGYMRDVVDRIVYSEDSVKVTCLVLASEPIRLGLLGIEAADQ